MVLKSFFRETVFADFHHSFISYLIEFSENIIGELTAAVFCEALFFIKTDITIMGKEANRFRFSQFVYTHRSEVLKKCR